MNFIFAFLFINALVAIQLCGGQNSTTGTEGQTDDATSTEKTALQKGMDPIFDLYHNFLDTVMPHNFYDDTDSPFSVKDVIYIVDESDFGKLQSDWQDIAQTFKGYAGCIIMGLLFIFFMPIVGMIYCCCHCCCHKCGGTQERMDPKRASCKRWTYTIILLTCTTLMLAGGIITFLGSDLLHKSLRNEDNNGLVGKMVQNLEHVQKFANDTINDLKDKLDETLIDDGLNKILPTIRDAANRTVQKVKDTINATDLLKKANNLGEAAKGALNDLQNLKEHVTNLKTLQTEIDIKLKNVKENFTTACNGCSSSLTSIVDNLSFHPDFSSLETLDEKAADVEKAVNISHFVDRAANQFDNVSSEVNSSVNKEIQEAEKQISSLNSTINRETEDLSGKADPFIKDVKDGKDYLDGDIDTIKDIADYIWYSCIGMGCAVILVVFFYYMGVLYGLCGERPGPQAACCNRETGAHLLCMGICCSFLFAWLLMLVVLLLFTLGGLSYSMACKYVSDGVENVKDFEDVLTDGFSLNFSKMFGIKDLTIAGMFQDCKDDKGLYSALNLKYVFDVDRQFNLSNVTAEVKKIEDSALNIPNITLMSEDLRKELLDFKDASLNSTNFTEYTEELNKPPFKDQQLNNAINGIEQYAGVLNATNPTSAAALLKVSRDLVDLKDNEIARVTGNMSALLKVVESLKKKAEQSVPEVIDNLIASIEKSEETFNKESNNITSQELKKAVNDILSTIEETVNSAITFIKDDLGRCRSLYDAAQGTVDAVCVVTLDPLNAIWFGLGWSLFFYIPCFIFAALLANLYKRSEKYRKKNASFDDPMRAQYTGDDSGHRGSRYEDNVPLTSMGKDQRYSANGAYNHGYQGREYEHEPRYHRDEHHGYPPDNYSRDRGIPRGGDGPHYAQPHADPYDQPPRYDDAVSDRYERGYRHGGYPRLSNY